MAAPVLAQLHPEGQHQVDDDRRAKGKKGSIDEVQSDAAGRNAKLLSESGAHTKNLVFYVIANPVHTLIALINVPN